MDDTMRSLQTLARPAFFFTSLFSGAAFAQVGPGVITFGFTPPATASVPTLSQWALWTLVAGIAFLAARAIKRSGRGSAAMSVAMGACALALVAAGVFGVHNAYSNGSIDAGVNVGQPQSFPSDIDERIINLGNQDVYVTTIQAEQGYQVVVPVGNTYPRCQVGTKIPANSSSPVCVVRVQSAGPT